MDQQLWKVDAIQSGTVLMDFADITGIARVHMCYPRYRERIYSQRSV